MAGGNPTEELLGFAVQKIVKALGMDVLL